MLHWPSYDLSYNTPIIHCPGPDTFSEESLLIFKFCIEKDTLAILVIAATIFKLQKVAIPFWKGNNCSHFHFLSNSAKTTHRSQIGSYNCLNCSMKVVYYVFTSTPGVVRIHFRTNPKIQVFVENQFFSFCGAPKNPKHLIWP